MKKLLTFLTLLTLSIGVGWAEEVTYTFGSNGYDIQSTETFTDGDFTISFGGTWNVQNAQFRPNQNASITFNYSKGVITKLVFTASSDAYQLTIDGTTVTDGTNAIGSMTSPGTWEYSTGSPTVVVTNTTTQRRLKSVTITYEESGTPSNPKAATPTFSPNGGTFYEPQTVTISSTTEGATIYYTKDGSDPDPASSESIANNGTVTIDATCTLTAIATATDYDPSNSYSKLFTINTPQTVEVPPTYNQSLISDFGKFYFVDKVNATTTDIWKTNTNGAVATGYFSSSNHDAESWLYSPYIDLTNASNPKLSFEQAINSYFGTVSEEATVWVKETSANNWTKLTITYPDKPSSGYSDYLSQTIDLSAYANKTIQVAFKYTSTSTTGGTWRVRNFKVENAGTFEIFRHYKTLGADNNNAEGWMGYWGGGATTPNGSDYADYTVQAESGSTVTFLIGHNNSNYQLLPSNVSVVDANGDPVENLVISDINSYGQTPVSFTMPASNVDITANFTYYRPTVRLAGHFNGRTGSNWVNDAAGPQFTYNETNDEYTIDAYFVGADDNGARDYFFLFLDNEAKHPSSGNYPINSVDGTEMSFSLGGGDSNNFSIAPGVYNIKISGDFSKLYVTKIQDPTITFNPAAGEVPSGTVVYATSSLTDIIEDIQDNDDWALGEVSVQVSTDGTTFTDNVTLTEDATITGKAFIGNIAYTGTANYTVVEVTGDEYTLVTNVNDIDENSEYVIVTSKAFDNQYYAFGAISGGTAAQSTDFALVGNKVIVTGESVNVLKMSGNNTDGWSIQQLSDDKYLKNGSTTNISTDNNQPTDTWSITIDENNLAKITYSATTSRSIIYRQNANGFKNYSTNDATGDEYSKVKLYKKGTITPKVETPTFDPEGGTYTEAQSVTINCATEDATIYYTTNGSNPTVQYGTVYTGPINVESTTTIKAIAVKDNYLNSDVATATYTIHTSVIGEGDFTLVESDGDIEAGREYIIINSAKNKAASAYASNRFTSTNQFTLSNNDKTASVESDVKVFILEAGENSGKYYLKDSEGNYYTPATGSGNITQNQTELTVQYSDGYVVITSGTVGSTRQIGYNEQGGQEVFGSFTPNSISPTGNGTLRPIYLYYRGGSAVATPVINPASQTFTEAFDATITCSTDGATIYYTTDGTDPTTSSAVYNGAIHVDKTMTIKAIAAKDGEVSGIAEAVYQCTMVENIAEYNALPKGTTGIVFKNPVIVQYHYISSSGKSYIYVKDETGCAYFHQPYETEGTPSMEQLEKGDIIAGGFCGDKVQDEMVNNQESNFFMLTNLENFNKTGNKALVEPEEYTVSDLTEDLNNHYITIKKVKLTNLYDPDDITYGGDKYFDIDDIHAIGFNKFNIDYASVVDNLNEYYNVTAIFTAYNNALEVHPIEIVKWAEKEVTLKELCEDGVKDESYKITNNLQGVVAIGKSLWVKDENGQSIWMTSPAEGDNNLEINAYGNTRLNQANYDQSNWLEVVFPDATTAKSFESTIIEGYSIEGVLNDKTSPKLTLSANAQVKKYGDSDEYAPNYYMAANFYGSQDCTGEANHGHYFFMNPKPQEFAHVVWVYYDGDSQMMVMPTGSHSSQNTHNFLGSFKVNMSLNENQDYTLVHGSGYGDFEAIIRLQKPTSKGAPEGTEYVVYPLNISDGTVTGINTVNVNGSEVKSVKYVNVAGIVSDRPFQGVNIVVTEYTDCSRTTSKMLKK